MCEVPFFSNHEISQRIFLDTHAVAQGKQLKYSRNEKFFKADSPK